MPRTLRSRGRPANGEDQDGKDDTTSSNGTNSQKVYAWYENETLIISGLSTELLSSLVEDNASQGGIKREEPQDLDRLESPRKRRRIDPSNEVQADPEKLLRVMRQNSSSNRKSALSVSEQDSQTQIKSPESGQLQKASSAAPTPRESRQPSMVPVDHEVSETIEPAAMNSPQPLTGAASAVSTPIRDRSPISTIPSPPQQSVRASKSPELPTDPDELNEADLPPAFLPRASSPPKTFSDKAAELLFDRFSPIPSPHQFIAALTRHPPSARSSATLFTLAENCQRALEAWQDEFIILDKKTAPLGNPPKKPATGGRVPVDPAAWNNAKESDVRGSLDVLPAGRGLRATSDATRQSGPRELRRRRADASIADGLGISEDDAGAERGKRARRPVRRFDIGTNGGMRESVEPHRRGRGGRLSALRGDGDRSAYMSPTPDTAGDTDTADDEDTPRSQSRRGGRGARGNGRGKVNATSNGRTGATNAATSKVPGEKRKQRVKSEKRSESMTAWWAERKRKALAEKMKEMQRNGQLADGSNPGSVSATNNATAKPATSAPSRPSGENIAPRSTTQTSAPPHTSYQHSYPQQRQPQQEQQQYQQNQQQAQPQQHHQHQQQQHHQRQQNQPQHLHQHQHQYQSQNQQQQYHYPVPSPQHHYHQDDAHKTALPSSLPPPPPHQQYPPHPHQIQSHQTPSYHPHSQGPPPSTQRYLAPSGPPMSPQPRHQQAPQQPPPSYQHQHQQGPLRLSNLVYPDYPPHPRGVTAIPSAPPPPPLQYNHSLSQSHSQSQSQSHGRGHSHSQSHNHNLPGSLPPPPPINPGYPQYDHRQHQLPPYQRPQEQQR